MRRREGRGKAWGKWRKLVSEQGRSGQSVAAFCRERGLCAPYFFAWKKRLREADAGQGVLRAPLTKFVEVQGAPVGPNPLIADEPLGFWMSQQGICVEGTRFDGMRSAITA